MHVFSCTEKYNKYYILYTIYIYYIIRTNEISEYAGKRTPTNLTAPEVSLYSKVVAQSYNLYRRKIFLGKIIASPFLYLQFYMSTHFWEDLSIQGAVLGGIRLSSVHHSPTSPALEMEKTFRRTNFPFQSIK